MTVLAATPPVQASSRSPLRIGAVAAATAATAAFLLPVLAGLARQWYDDPNATYGALVAAAAAVSARQRWPSLRTVPLEGSPWGTAVFAAAATLYVIATLAADVFLLRATSVMLCGGAVLFVGGAAHLRLLAAPILLALAAIPPPGALVTQLTMPLQLAASRLAAMILDVCGIGVVRDGNVLTLSGATLEVAEACSGMRSIVTLLALVAVFAGTCKVDARKVMLLGIATVPVALAGNALRVAATAVLVSRMGESATRGIVHEATGFAAFAVMCAALGILYVLAARCTRSRSVQP